MYKHALCCNNKIFETDYFISKRGLFQLVVLEAEQPKCRCLQLVGTSTILQYGRWNPMSGEQQGAMQKRTCLRQGEVSDGNKYLLLWAKPLVHLGGFTASLAVLYWEPSLRMSFWLGQFVFKPMPLLSLLWNFSLVPRCQEDAEQLKLCKTILSVFIF